MKMPDFDDQPDTTDELANAARLFADAGDQPDLQLEAILHSVAAALRLLREDHEWSQLAPLQYLFAGLSRLSGGHPDPVLQPQRGDRKAGKSGSLVGPMVFKQVYILLAHEILLRGKWKKTAADRRVAELAAAAGFTSTEGKPISADMVRGWRCYLTTPEMYLVEELLKPYIAGLGDILDPSKVEQAAEELLCHSASSYAGIEISRNPTLL